MNTDHTGIVTIEELEAELKKLDLALPASRLSVIVDSPPHGISFSQFMVLVTDFEALFTP